MERLDYKVLLRHSGNIATFSVLTDRKQTTEGGSKQLEIPSLLNGWCARLAQVPRGKTVVPLLQGA